MTDSRIFNESVFGSYGTLKSFFDQSHAAHEVLEQRNGNFSGTLNPLNPKLAGKWQVCQIASAPFRWIAAIALEIIAGIASLLNAIGFSEQLSKDAQDLKIGFNIFSQRKTHLFQVADTVNAPNAEGDRVNESGAIPESRIPDRRVTSRTYCGYHKKVQFGHNQGICRGESFWFLHLYLKTKNHFSDPRNHMAALGSQFTYGGGMDPTLLQSLHLKKGKLLNLKIGTQPQSSHGSAALPLIKKTPQEWRSSVRELSLQLHNLSPGAYATGLPLHQTAYIKIHSNLSFFFDPNHGIIEINGPNQGKNLYQLLKKTLKETGDRSEKFPNTQLHLDIMPITTRH